MPGQVFRSLEGQDVPTEATQVLDAIVADPSPVVAGRPRTLGVMVASVDGHASVDGRSGGLGGPEDRAIFRGLRQRADALLVGPGTLNLERYSTTLDPPHRAARVAAGQTPEPLLATISRSFSLDPDVPLLHEALTRVAVYTEVEPPFAVDSERVDVVRLPQATPGAALTDLHERGMQLVNCEGGPHLLAALAGDGLLDELVLTVSPLLVGGAHPLTILTGEIGPEPLPLRLRGTWRAGDVLFLHYHLIHGSPACPTS